MMSARRIRKGCRGFLAFVRDVEKKAVEFEHVPIVSEFLNIFPDELLGLPPERDRIKY